MFESFVALGISAILVFLFCWVMRPDEINGLFNSMGLNYDSIRDFLATNKKMGMNTAAALLIGLTFFGGILWQVHLIKDVDSWDKSPPSRIIPVGVIAFIIFLGVVVSSIISYRDESRGLHLSYVFLYSGKALILCFALILQSYLSPIVFAYSVSCVIYYLFYHGELDPFPLIAGSFKWVFSYAPKWLSWLYVAFVTIFSFFGALKDSDFDFDFDASP